MGFEPQTDWALFFVEVCVFSLCLLQCKNMQVRLICNSQLPVGVSVSMNGSVCVCGIVIEWQSVPSLSHSDSWDRLQHPRDPYQDKQA